MSRSEGTHPVVRVVVAAVAVIACAWFILGVIQGHAQTQAAALIPNRTTISSANLGKVMHLLDRAGTLNPDRAIDILRAEAYVHSGHDSAAVRSMQRVVRDEPDNINAWLLLRIAAYPIDRALSDHALAEQRHLAPPVPAAP